jgi:sarcosine oxidase, subunit gamma
MPEVSSLRVPPWVDVTPGSVTQLPPAARYVLRGGDAVRQAAGVAFGLTVPHETCRAVSEGERAALWQGPDEWLLIGAVEETLALGANLSAALSALPHSLVDVSQRQTALLVSGAHATTLLAAGCPLDLDAAAFPVGMCTRTMFAKAEVVLWRQAPANFRLEVWRSFAAYVSQYLAEAARGII